MTEILKGAPVAASIIEKAARKTERLKEKGIVATLAVVRFGSRAVSYTHLIDSLPGKKVLIKGNHELWWNGINKLNKMYDDIFFLQNTFCLLYTSKTSL